MQRREFLGALTGAALCLKNAPATESKTFEGIFPIMQTPFTEGNSVDMEDLAAEAKFLDRCGVPGMVWPQLASEYASLSPDERFAGAETIVKAARNLKPAVVIGVQGPDVESAVRYARHAEQLGPDAIIAIPLRDTKDRLKLLAYYRAIAGECKRPLFVQTIGDMSVDFVLEMAKEIPTLRYVKDEAGQTLPRITEYRTRGADLIRGVFTGAAAKTLLDELARGSSGSMPASGFADLYVQAWDLWRAGRRDPAIDMFSKALLMINEVQAYGLASMKYILQLRGVFKNTRCRQKGDSIFDAQAQRSVRETYDFVKRYFTA